MDKILGLGDVFGLGGSNFNPLLLIPVLFVVVSAAAVFVFGFKKAENPKFRKIVSSGSSATDAGSKRKKRANATAVATGAAIISASVQAPSNANKQQPLATPASKTVKKEPSAAKKPPTTAAAINKPTKKTNAKSASSNNNKAAKVTTTVGSVDAEAVGGEWQTVLTKKQKQLKQSDPQLPADGDMAELLAAALDKQATAIAKKKVLANNNKKAVAKKQQSQQQQSEQPLTEPVTEQVALQPELAAQSVGVAEALPMDLMESKKIPLAEPSINIAVNDIAHTNLVFDELGGAEWMQTKPLKKNKKRALRE